MGGGGKGGSSSSTQKTEPWGGVKQPLKDLYANVGGMGPMEPYPYPGVVPFSPASVGAMEATTNRAMQGNPLLAMAQGGAGQTLGGGYLDPSTNPVFQRGFQSSYRDIVPQVDASAIASGRYGGGLSQMNKIEALGDAWSDQWSNQYGAERDRMLRTQAMSPSLAQADYYDIDRLAGVGAQQEGKAGQYLSDAMSKWQQQQKAPFDLASFQSGIYSGASPYASTSGTPASSGGNPIGGLMAGGMMGAGLGAMTAPAGATGMAALGGPWGMAAGAGLGLMSAMK